MSDTNPIEARELPCSCRDSPKGILGQCVLCREEHTCAPMGRSGLRISIERLTSIVLPVRPCACVPQDRAVRLRRKAVLSDSGSVLRQRGSSTAAVWTQDRPCQRHSVDDTWTDERNTTQETVSKLRVRRFLAPTAEHPKPKPSSFFFSSLGKGYSSSRFDCVISGRSGQQLSFPSKKPPV